ncbi:MAG TPA: PRC-barrel domain-containing protein [Acetobacteraceae bacterium]|nr:PRC-barrel domain-containing protein [Acetobacteraceae bacterium]
MRRIICGSAAALLLLAAAPAQQTDGTAPSPPPTPAAPASPQGNPNLQVATVKLKGGWRASKVIGSAVYNDQNQEIGSVDDLIVGQQNRIEMAVIQVGGFLGIGGKLVAVPYHDLQMVPTKDGRRLMMPGATKDALKRMPAFTYG